MAEKDEVDAGGPSDRSLKISKSAFDRLEALRRAYQDAAQRLTREDDYPDFFVEGSGPPWHERWPEVVTGNRQFGEERMLYVDRLAQDDYPDFFVEGSGPPWHERWPEVVTAPFDPANTQQRVRAIQKLNVMQAFARLRERSR